MKMELVLDGEKPLTWNALYAGRHWTKRKREADRVHLLVAASVLSQHGQPPKFDGRVDITISYTSNEKRTVKDPCNIPAKIYIDGLVRAGVIKDDTYEYVASVTTKRKMGESRYVTICVENEKDAR